jgi:capsular polysaccharide biosynthesis protein
VARAYSQSALSLTETGVSVTSGQAQNAYMDANQPPPPPRNLTPGKAFASVFMAIFLLIFLSSAAITFTLPESYTSVARVRAATDEQLQSLQSSEVLMAVIDRLDLKKEYAKRYGESDPLSTERTMELVRRLVQVRRVRGTEVAEIRVEDLDRDEAAHLANSIARTGVTNAAFSAARGQGETNEIIDLAIPSLKPSRPNKPLNLALGALVGGFLGIMAGGVAARLAIGFGRDTRVQMASPSTTP